MGKIPKALNLFIFINSLNFWSQNIKISLLKEKIHEIRAQTVKGLEPEIQRIVERNKEDLRKAQELHLTDMRFKKEQISEEYDRKM